MKKRIIIGTGITLIFIVGIIISINFLNYLRIKNAKIEVVLKDNLELTFLDNKKVSDNIISINGHIIDDYKIDTTKLGKQTIKFNFINDDHIKVSYQYDIKVVDKVKPLIWLNSSYRVKKGSNPNFYQNILCGDDTDSHPNCYIEGDYNLNKVGNYDVVFKAIDKSGNSNEKKFTLIVYEPKKSSSKSTSKKVRTKFTDVVKNHKSSKTKIGIDVSKWQGNINWKKVKEAGVEFAIIKIGSTKGTNGQYFLDEKFLQNIKGAKENNILVGLYFYSYANSKKQAKNDAQWVIKQIKDYDIDLPVAFDWEEWSNFNDYHLSFFELTSLAETFLSELEKKGYQGLLYSSKVYLEEIWLPTNYNLWLAHYTNKTDYQGKYKFWQLCNNGLVDGINGNVDIDIMYE